MATLTPAEVLYEQEHIHDDKRPEVIAVNTVCLVIACLAVVLRFTSRRIARTSLGSDDWLMIPALIFYIAFSTCSYLLVRYGMGRHIILLTDPRHFAIFTMAAATLYSATTLFFKLSILCLYRRIFPQLWFKSLLMATGAFLIAQGITFIFTTVLQCLPINSQWERDPGKPPKCIDLPIVAFIAGAINTFTSIAILCLPLPLVWRLKMSRRRKRLVMLLFALGGGECLISVARLYFAHTFKSADATYGNVPFATLTGAELGVGILTACLPVSRPVYLYVFDWRGRAAGRKSSDSSGLEKNNRGAGKEMRQNRDVEHWAHGPLTSSAACTPKRTSKCQVGGLSSQLSGNTLGGDEGRPEPTSAVSEPEATLVSAGGLRKERMVVSKGGILVTREVDLSEGRPSSSDESA